MKKINWKEKTGITEVQWLQGVSAVLTGVAAHFGYETEAMYIGPTSHFVLAAIGALLQKYNKAKIKKNGKVSDIALNSAVDISHVQSEDLRMANSEILVIKHQLAGYKARFSEEQEHVVFTKP